MSRSHLRLRLRSGAREAQHGPVELGEGSQLGRFLLERKLGRGAAGTVYLARDTLLGGVLALKVLHSDLFSDKEVRERFRRELLLARRVTHPGVCRIHDMHEEAGAIFLTLEYVPGETLASLIHAQGRLDAPRTLQILEELTPPLAAAHKAGVIHRDLKPGNIMVRDDGTVSILDFGMATADDLQRITRAGRTVGSLRFIAPEVWEGKAATTASDLYAVGVTLYACLAGRLPYDVQTPAAMFEALKKPPPPLTELGVHPAVDAVVRRAMVRDPKKRFATIEALLLAFAQAVRDAGGGPRNEHDEPTTSTGTVLVRDRSDAGSAIRSDAGKAVDPLMPRETLVSASPFVQAAPAARSSRLGLWITAALGVVIAAAVIAALVLEPSTVVAGTKREHLVTRPDTPDEEAAEELVPEEAPTPPEPMLALEPLKPRPERAVVAGAERVRALMERRGLRQSDVPQLDRLVDLAQRMERANRPDEARQATDRALAMATAVAIDRSFVTAKQKRLVERAERAPPALKARLVDTLTDVETRAARADYVGANLAINRGLDLTP